MEVIDFEMMKKLKETNDEFLDFFVVVEKHFKGKKIGVLKRVVYASKYIANIFFYALPSAKNKKELKPAFIKIFKEFIRVLEED